MITPFRFSLLILAGWPLCSSAAPAYTETEQGVEFVIGGAHVEVAAPKPGIFRLTTTYKGAAAAPMGSIFIDPAPAHESWAVFTEGNQVGVRTGSGTLLVDEATGAWMLTGTSGNAVLAQGTLAVLGTDSARGQDALSLTVGISKSIPFRAYGSGDGNPAGALLRSGGNSHLGNGHACIPYYWCDAGYGAFGVTSDDERPAKWKADAEKGAITWTFPGDAAVLYLMPARDLREAATHYADLTGHPKVPPEWTFGYLQSRWGWVDKAYIDSTLKTFHDHQLPVDAFIFDFEGYTKHPDYSLKPAGEPGFPDFTMNPLLFPKPARDIADYNKQGLRVVLIRKPRIGDSDRLAMLRAKGWIRVRGKNGESGEAFDARGLDYAKPEARDWYSQNSQELIGDGIAGWWNDEGESTYTKYYYWNLAEYQALARFRPNARLWSINRAFEPGLQRFGVAAWSGDIATDWKTLAMTPETLLGWGLAGMPYTACDIGGFYGYKDPKTHGATPPEMMARWMEEGVFLPVMRAHSVVTIPPHFPWLSGPEAEAAIRSALDLRYRLIPYYYSLAHETFETGVPFMRPLVMEFPDDPKVYDNADQWMMGDALMAAPILAEGGKRRVYFPDHMVTLDGTRTYKKGDEIDVTEGLDGIPVYVRVGSILPLGPVLRNTGELPGGPLEVRVYPGRDAAFTLVEDDGISYDYLKGVVRKTRFEWNDRTRTLSWKREGSYEGTNVFTAMRVELFRPLGKQEVQAQLSDGGSLSFAPEGNSSGMR